MSIKATINNLQLFRATYAKRIADSCTSEGTRTVLVPIFQIISTLIVSVKEADKKYFCADDRTALTFIAEQLKEMRDGTDIDYIYQKSEYLGGYPSVYVPDMDNEVRILLEIVSDLLA